MIGVCGPSFGTANSIWQMQSMPNMQNVPAGKEEVSVHKKNVAKKVLLGATILAGTIAAGIGIRKGLNIKKLNQEFSKSFDELFKKSNDKINSLKLMQTEQSIFDPEITTKQLQEAAKLSKESKDLKYLQNFTNAFLEDDRGLLVELSRPASMSERFFQSLPKNVQEAINNKDYVTAKKLYADWGDTLFCKANTAGDTVAESVENVFGKGAKIKPHTYDLTKESDKIATQVYSFRSGYSDVTINSANEIAADINIKNTIPVDTRKFPLPKDQQYTIHQVSEDGKPVVSLVCRAREPVDAINIIELLSPNSSLTPAQKDLLKLRNLENFPLKDFQLLTFGNIKYLNYDAILSTIQTYANQVHV